MKHWERWRIPILLAPTMSVIGVLFLGGLWFGLLRSLGWNPQIGADTLSFSAYTEILVGERHATDFWRGLGLSLWVSLASTITAAAGGLAVALVLRETFFGKRLGVFLFQFNLPIPHIVAAIGILFVLSQSGLLSRVLASAGVLSSPGDFPVLVRDRAGMGIIAAYAWKEIPFVGVIALAVLQSVGADYENVAQNLGAGRWQRFRDVIFPLVRPALLSASMIVFAFSFGAYEIPAILGVRFPRALPVLALDFFRNADLNARAEAMALSMIMAVIVMGVVAGYMAINHRQKHQVG